MGYGGKSYTRQTYTRNSASYSVFTHRVKETCFLQQEFNKVPEQQCSSRTYTASINLSWRKYSASVEVWVFFHICVQFKLSTSQAVFSHSDFELMNLQCNRKHDFCSTLVLQVWSIHGYSDWREISRVLSWGPHLFEKIKIWLGVPLNLLCNYKSIEAMGLWCKILFGKSSALFLSQLSSLLLML